MEVEALQKDLDAKLKLLSYKQTKGEDIATKGNATTIERHRDALVYLAKEADESKLKIDEEKIASGEQMVEVCAWSVWIDKVIEGVDAEIEHLWKCLGEAKQKLWTAEKESVYCDNVDHTSWFKTLTLSVQHGIYLLNRLWHNLPVKKVTQWLPIDYSLR